MRVSRFDFAPGAETYQVVLDDLPDPTAFVLDSFGSIYVGTMGRSSPGGTYGGRWPYREATWRTRHEQTLHAHVRKRMRPHVRRSMDPTDR